jgi:predicted nucleic-acid-binding protein
VKGLDTNVLVRYLVRDDPEQTARATELIEEGADRGERFFVASVVLCELVWVLDRAYGYERAEIAISIEGVLQTRSFFFADKDILWQSLADYRKGKGGFADYLIGRLGERAGCERTLSFDRALRENPRFEVL